MDIEVPARQFKSVVDVGEFYEDRGVTRDVTDTDFDERARLGFAKQILFWLVVFSLVVILVSYLTIVMYPENEQLVLLVDTVLDVTKTVVPSTVTLVLGFYFGKAAGNADG